jgi:ABC-type metal ion transport system substrate-binding protein
VDSFHNIGWGLIDKQLITEDKANKNGYTVAIFRPTQSASPWVNDVESQYPKQMESIRKIVKMYQSKRLMDVLHDVYYLYPEYAVNSKIKAEVGRQTYESDSYLNPEYDYSTE